jgi:hypothetical protein
MISPICDSLLDYTPKLKLMEITENPIGGGSNWVLASNDAM